MLASIPTDFIVDLESILNKDHLFEPALTPTLDHGLSEDLFDAFDGIEEDIINCPYCDVSVLKCGI